VHAVGSELQRQRLADELDGGLGRRVEAGRRPGDLTVERRHLHDAAPGRAQGGQRGTQRRQVPQHGNLEQRPCLRVADLLDRAVQAVAGVVEQHIQAAGVADRLGQPLLGVGRGDIEGDRRDLCAHRRFRDELVEQVGPAAYGDDVSARARARSVTRRPNPEVAPVISQFSDMGLLLAT
jgi:hypothetical protein